ncbi:Glycosyltransferase [Musa troglodytarum]|uniref:Glycosyltransferase n=1 Tax=Musa troglodytarum TaxID=320322 RepID=A0A9E7GN17_9LILI|nr:Glycosyltransferase [Musa troglodytarum]
MGNPTSHVRRSLSWVGLSLSGNSGSAGAKTEQKLTSDHPDAKIKTGEKLQRKPLCDLTQRRADICDMEGDIRVHGNSSSVLFVTSSGLQESYRIQPHPRKGDHAALATVTEVTVRSTTEEEAPKCTTKSRVPAGLSRYDIIDLNQDHEVRCYSHVIVGIMFHGDLYIDPTKAGGLTMLDYAAYLRKSLGLKRETAIKLANPDEEKKPRVLIVNRKGTRRFTNVDEIARMVEMSGFQAVISEMHENKSLAEFAQVVNSCDVLLGLHGAGMTNLIFLPTNGILIQIVPLGRMEDVCWINYGAPAVRVKLHYLQYSIRAPESNLIDQFPKDDPVILDPKAVFEKQGSARWVSLYMHRQTVKLDVERLVTVAHFTRLRVPLAQRADHDAEAERAWRGPLQLRNYRIRPRKVIEKGSPNRCPEVGTRQRPNSSVCRSLHSTEEEKVLLQSRLATTAPLRRRRSLPVLPGNRADADGFQTEVGSERQPVAKIQIRASHRRMPCGHHDLLGVGLGPSLLPPQSDHDAVNGDDHGIQGSRKAPLGKEDAQSSQVLESNKEKAEGGEKNVIVVDSTPNEETNIHKLTETKTEIEQNGMSVTADDPSRNQEETHDRLALPTISNYTINDRTQGDGTVVLEHSDGGEQIQTPERKPLCDDSDRRTDVCEMHGDVRIPGNSSSIIFVEASKTEQKELWQIHPYPRKGDEACFKGVRELAVEAGSEAPPCTINHDAPAIVFSTGGYAGNLFHDFSDLLVPLFLTARPFDGEVQFVVTDFKNWWITKYLPVLQKLSKYPAIDFDKDKEVHCFKQVKVGLRAHNDFHIDPARAPNGYTMLDFTKLTRSAFSLARETLVNIEDLSVRKPKLLIIARKQSRAFTNINEIVEMADGLGYEVVVQEADAGSDIARVAGIVNSCDVMMGVHGSGLTQMVFLPLNATIIQIVPWGGLEGKAMMDYGNPAKEMGLHYVQYSIAIDESSLTEQYPRDHPVFTDPMSFHSRGFQVLRSTFMDNQNVKLDVNKFKDVLWKALEHLIQ